jgi:hypothetical protein
MLRLVSFLWAFTFTASILQAQPITKNDLKLLQKKQDSLSILSWRISNEIHPEMRLKSDSLFTRVLVRALQINNSFHFGFDSLLIAKTYAPDSSFKIFTWQIEPKKNIIRQKGVIQYKTQDGKMKITPLIDNSDYMETTNEIVGAKNWIGAIYYSILLHEYNGKKYYTLLGFDDNNTESNKKWIEVLTFNEKGEPIFGNNNIQHTELGLRNRLALEYKKESRLKLNWDKEQNMIIYDHLSSENGFVNQRKTYVPDGDYEGLKWENGKWIHLPKVMCNCPLSTKENKEQAGKPIFDRNGNRINN